MGYRAVRGQSTDHAVKDWLRFVHGTGIECAELYIHMIIWEVSDELGVCTAALLGRLSGGIGEGASEDAGADEREGDAV